MCETLYILVINFRYKLKIIKEFLPNNFTFDFKFIEREIISPLHEHPLHNEKGVTKTTWFCDAVDIKGTCLSGH